MAIDYPRAMAAYKVGAEGGDALSQYVLGYMYYEGQGVGVDFKQAQTWIEIWPEKKIRYQSNILQNFKML